MCLTVALSWSVAVTSWTVSSRTVSSRTVSSTSGDFTMSWTVSSTSGAFVFNLLHNALSARQAPNGPRVIWVIWVKCRHVRRAKWPVDKKSETVLQVFQIFLFNDVYKWPPSVEISKIRAAKIVIIIFWSLRWCYFGCIIPWPASLCAADVFTELIICRAFFELSGVFRMFRECWDAEWCSEMPFWMLECPMMFWDAVSNARIPNFVQKAIQNQRHPRLLKV